MGAAKIFGRNRVSGTRKKLNNGIKYTDFAKVFAEYLKYDFEKLRRSEFAPDFKVSKYIRDGLDWVHLIDKFEERFGLTYISYDIWDRFGGRPNASRGICSKLKLFQLFLFISEIPKRDQKDIPRRKTKLAPTNIDEREKLRLIVARLIPGFRGSEENLPDCYRLNLSPRAWFYLLSDLEKYAKSNGYAVPVDSYYDLIEDRLCIVVDDIFSLMSKSKVSTIMPRAPKMTFSKALGEIVSSYQTAESGYLNLSPISEAWLFLDLETLEDAYMFNLDMDGYFDLFEKNQGRVKVEELIDLVGIYYSNCSGV